ncbi:MAG TPA: FlgO family outer membrane protein [Blastocatellia bacterium]|nr:FlgO family outer membrane protein [Blastocatellia bacterium]
MSQQIKRSYEFGPFRIDTVNRLLLRDGEPVPLKAKAVETLLVLVESKGQVLEKDDLMQALWPDSFVEEANLTQNIYMLRKALGDNSYIETVPRRGYRFCAQVRQWEYTAADLVLREQTRTSVIFEEEDEISTDVETGVTSAPATLAETSSLGWGNRIVSRPLVAGLIIIVLATFGTYVWRQNKSAQKGSIASIKSIAVLPFKTLQAASGDEYLGLGMADALITRLSRLGRVIIPPTSAVRKYAELDQPADQAGRELGVDAVLEGTIQRSDNGVRVTVRLMRLADGRTLWADQFDEPLTSVFRLQDSISTRAADVLALKLSGDEEKLLTRNYTSDAEAYQLYLKGRYFWNKRTEQDLKRAIGSFREAIAHDSNYALAYTGLADAYLQLPGYSEAASMEIYPNAKAAAAKALDLDNTLAEAHNSVAGVLSYFEWDWAAAEEEYRRALALDPNYAAAHHRLGVQLAAMGRFDEALFELRRAQELDPLSPITNAILAATYYEARRYDEAIAQLHKTLELDGNFGVAHVGLARTYEAQGLNDEAFKEYLKWRTLAGDSSESLAEMQQAYIAGGLKSFHSRRLKTLLKKAEQTHVRPTEVAAIYARLGEKEQAIRWLERAVSEHEGEVVWLKVLPEYDSLRAEARFTRLLERINLI